MSTQLGAVPRNASGSGAAAARPPARRRRRPAALTGRGRRDRRLPATWPVDDPNSALGPSTAEPQQARHRDRILEFVRTIHPHLDAQRNPAGGRPPRSPRCECFRGSAVPPKLQIEPADSLLTITSARVPVAGASAAPQTALSCRRSRPRGSPVVTRARVPVSGGSEMACPIRERPYL